MCVGWRRARGEEDGSGARVSGCGGGRGGRPGGSGRRHRRIGELLGKVWLRSVGLIGL